MQESGHDIWGFVIYRTTYASEEDWAEFLRRLQFRLTKPLERYNGRDILDAFKWTIFSDRDLFDGADTATIRAHFREWCDRAALEERPASAPPLEDLEPSQRTKWNGSARYQFCIQVDEASLHSVVYGAIAPPAPVPFLTGWAKLINKRWVPIEENPRRRPGWEETLQYEPVEGIRERDIGWIKAPYQYVMLEYYYGPEMLNGWKSYWCRPPEVSGLHYR